MRRRSRRFGSVQVGMRWLRVTCALMAVGLVGQGFVWAQAPARVDKDPITSPDPDTPSNASGAAAAEAARIEKERGRYTLRTDAYEVRLNATVLDQSGKAVQSLDKDAFKVYE